jgi:membrane protease YdiL (CAAX protease family)
MSATASIDDRVERRTRALGVQSWAVDAGVLVGGTGLLLFRPFAIGGSGTLAVLTATYVAILTASLPVPMERDERRAPVPIVLGIGLAAFALGSLVVGPRPPAPVASAAWAMNALAGVAEEAFFRRFLYGRLARWSVPVAIGVSAMTFALIHVPAYGVAALWVDLGAGLLLSWQRWASGTWTVPAATHVAANLLAVMR